MSDYCMEITILKEAGYEEALYALSLNMKKTPEEMPPVLRRLAPKGNGHNKVLEMIDVWLLVKAPRYWWSEADTYRLTSKSSESTMHTLKQDLLRADENDTWDDLFEVCPIQDVVLNLLGCVERNDLVGMKQELPESFLQRRVWKLNYMNLRNIIGQRRNHRLPHWQAFCQYMLANVGHPELLEM